ncbi:IS4 family transposase [Leptospira borgpetersenii]|uniref:IS4 family transposase n=1 Tax=Leptospira borgpetersenii TaxID=174 RepID=UPI0027DBB24D|nr:IS4 family transposase [Leptospira borgpetersenii]
MKPSAFTRNRQLTLPRLLIAMINLLNKSLAVELYRYFKNLGKKAVTKQAFSFARENLNPQVFESLNEIFVNSYYKNVTNCKTHKGYIVAACDATGISLPKTKEFVKNFGCVKNQLGESESPNANSSIIFDIYNDIILSSTVGPHRTSERSMALHHIEKLRSISALQNKKLILLFDRGYPSMELIGKLMANGIHFIVRSNTRWLKEAKIAGEYKEYDKVKNILITNNMQKKKEWLKEYANTKGNLFSLRFVGSRYKDGQVGIFVTDLPDSEFSREAIVSLYGKRWNIETHFRFEKYSLELENVASKTSIRFLQEYYAKILTFNLASLLIQEAQEEYDQSIQNKKVKTKYDYKITRNIAIGILKGELPRLLSGTEPMNSVFDEMKAVLIKHRLPVTPNRTFNRKHKVRKRKFEIYYGRVS